MYYNVTRSLDSVPERRKKMGEPLSELIPLRVTKTMRLKIEEAAKKDGRNRSNYLRHLVERALVQEGAS
jgi:hypothetical protein